MKKFNIYLLFALLILLTPNSCSTNELEEDGLLQEELTVDDILNNENFIKAYEDYSILAMKTIKKIKQLSVDDKEFVEGLIIKGGLNSNQEFEKYAKIMGYQNIEDYYEHRKTAFNRNLKGFIYDLNNKKTDNLKELLHIAASKITFFSPVKLRISGDDCYRDADEEYDFCLSNAIINRFFDGLDCIEQLGIDYYIDFCLNEYADFSFDLAVYSCDNHYEYALTICDIYSDYD